MGQAEFCERAAAVLQVLEAHQAAQRSLATRAALLLARGERDAALRALAELVTSACCDGEREGWFALGGDLLRTSSQPRADLTPDRTGSGSTAA